MLPTGILSLVEILPEEGIFKYAVAASALILLTGTVITNVSIGQLVV